MNKNMNQMKTNFSGLDLHESTKRMLMLCQCFGLIPVSGLISGKLQYKRSSFKVRYSLIILAAHFFMAVMTFVRVFFNEVTFRSCNVIMIYLPGFLIHSQFFKLAQDWPELMKRWQQVEDNFNKEIYEVQLLKKRGGFTRLTFFTSIIIVLITICEYSFSLGSVYNQIATKNQENPLQEMIETLFNFVTDYVKYNRILAFILLAINFYCTFIWNFMDLFIIIMCHALASRFQIISSKIFQSTKEELENEYYWQKMREDYNKVAELFHYLDDKLSAIVLLSFTTNIYYILIQLYRSISLHYSNLENIYFFVSFGMLLLRTSAVSILAAKINDASRLPLQFLTLQPSEFYCPDLERLINQISQNNIALTGFKLFRITRGFLFRIAGTIVTYELFIFQFNFSMMIFNTIENEND